MQVAVVLAIRVVEEVLLNFFVEASWLYVLQLYYCKTCEAKPLLPFMFPTCTLAQLLPRLQFTYRFISSSGEWFFFMRTRSQFPGLDPHQSARPPPRRRGRRDPFRSCQILVCGFGPRGGGRIPARPGCEKVIRSVTLATRGKLNMCARTHERAKWRPTRVHSLAVGGDCVTDEFSW